MSLTLADTVMAAVHENGVNDFMTAFFKARPRHLVYGTPAFVPVTTVAATSISGMTFPGVPGGIDLLVVFALPTIDFEPDSSGGASPLPPGPGQLAVHTTVRLTVACKRTRDPRNNENENEFVPLSTSLELFATGLPLVSVFGPGAGEIRFQLDRLEIVDIKPDSLESVLECLLLMMLRAALSNFRLPFSAMSVGFITLILKNGPLIETDQIKVFGDVV
jgi:hypothetical protein